MGTLSKMSVGRYKAEVEAVLTYMQKTLPADNEPESDDTLGAPTPLSESTVGAMDWDDDDLSFNEEDFDPFDLADVRRKKRKLAKLQAELREAMGEAMHKAAGKDQKEEQREQRSEEREEVPTLSAAQTADTVRTRIHEAAGTVENAKAEARKD